MAIAGASVAPNPDHVMIDKGVLYKDYTTASPLQIGVAEGDIEFLVERSFRWTPYNNQVSTRTKGLGRKQIVDASLKIPSISMSPEALTVCYAGLRLTDNSTYWTVTEDHDILTTDYWTDATLIGTTQSGKYILVELDNAIGEATSQAETLKKDEEVIFEIMLYACVDTSNPDVIPYKKHLEK
jgi:hypothetical protein